MHQHCTNNWEGILAKGEPSLLPIGEERDTCKKYFKIGLIVEKGYLQKYLSHWLIVEENKYIYYRTYRQASPPANIVMPKIK